MKSAQNKRAVIVGIFVFIGLAILIAGVLTLGGQRKTFVKKITLKAIFDDVSGLQAGNNIWFSGVKVGTVRKMQFYGNSQVEIIMNIEQQARQYIHKNAKAKIGSEGLIGNKIIVISGGTAQAPPVEDGDIIGVEKTLSTDDMLFTLQENNKNLLDITRDFKMVSKRIVDGDGTIGKLLKDESLLNNMQSLISIMKKASMNTEQLTSNLSDYSSKLQKNGSLANDLVTDTLIFRDIRATVAQLKEVANTANEVTNNIKKASSSLNNMSGPVGVLLNDQQAASDLKLTLKNLQSGTEKLDENMEALQHNFLLRGFFRKKAKQQAKIKNN